MEREGKEKKEKESKGIKRKEKETEEIQSYRKERKSLEKCFKKSWLAVLDFFKSCFI